MRKVDCPEGAKRCSICLVIFPLTTEYFHRSNRHKDGFKGQCKGCRRARDYEANKSHILKKRKQHYEENKEEALAKQKVYRNSNKEYYRNYHKEYYLKNRTFLKKQANAHYYENRESQKIKRSEYNKRYWSTDIGRFKRKQYKMRRKDLSGKLPDTLTQKEWEEALQKFKGACAYCGAKSDEIQQDHVIPLSKGGGYIKQNIIPACPSCNYSKGAKKMETWYQERDFFSQEKFDDIRLWMGVDLIYNTQQLSIL